MRWYRCVSGLPGVGVVQEDDGQAPGAPEQNPDTPTRDAFHERRHADVLALDGVASALHQNGGSSSPSSSAPEPPPSSTATAKFLTVLPFLVWLLPS